MSGESNVETRIVMASFDAFAALCAGAGGGELLPEAFAACEASDYPGGILDMIGRVTKGVTRSGARWSLFLSLPVDRPDAADAADAGTARFTDAAGRVSEGLWRRDGMEGRLCQSYNGGASWACHDVLPCAGDDMAVAMWDAEGVVPSVARVDSSFGTTLLEELDAGQYAPDPAFCNVPAGDSDEAYRAWTQSIYLDGKDGWNRFESVCEMRAGRMDGSEMALRGVCNLEGFYHSIAVELTQLDRTSFLYGVQLYRMCGAAGATAEPASRFFSAEEWQRMNE